MIVMMMRRRMSTQCWLAVIASLLLLVEAVEGLPTILKPNNDTQVEPPWVQDPNGRGTTGLVLSCVLTLGLCVWTAVHLNVDPAASHTKILRRKCLWVVIGLFSPEIVLVSSYDQWQKARSLHRRVKNRRITRATNLRSVYTPAAAGEDLSGYGLLQLKKKTFAFWAKQWKAIQDRFQNIGSKERKEEHPFSMTCSFFIVMGGTIVKTTDNKDKDDSANEKSILTAEEYCTLTPEGFEYLLDRGVLTDAVLEQKEILDKGKADFLAKFLVCVQAAWMILQCILRKLNHLPVTLIELNTLMHVVIALLMYFFWWEKPLDVGQPIPVDSDPDLAAILLSLDMLRSQGVTVCMNTEVLPVYDLKPLMHNHPTLYNKAFQGLGPLKFLGSTLPGWDEKENRKWALWDLARADRRLANEGREDIVTLLPQLRLEEPEPETTSSGVATAAAEKEVEIRGSDGERKVPRAMVVAHENKAAKLTKQELATLFQAAKAMERDKYHEIKQHYKETLEKMKDPGEKLPWDEEFRVQRMKNLHFDMDIVLSEIQDWNDPHIILSLLNIAYGAAHASVWNSHFPTQLEKFMWRWSCLTLLLPALVTSAKWITQKCPNKWHMDYYLNRAVQVLLHPILVIYFSARVFVVVESFVSIRTEMVWTCHLCNCHNAHGRGWCGNCKHTPKLIPAVINPTGKTYPECCQGVASKPGSKVEVEVSVQEDEEEEDPSWGAVYLG
ncbi:hypothetical protein FN846DRAFT_992436 [Sphaerosporella brunnea]|uniref:RanBP2-type domain-containing protein n=1 Tax=Sphaerosporella brunnea TaxID=1250544 RepID=A0A5J5ELX9_9PEZI|nr:hypothetical protein FN846DRAFT_992436 [Sphaerosporella brunnea]